MTIPTGNINARSRKRKEPKTIASYEAEKAGIFARLLGTAITESAFDLVGDVRVRTTTLSPNVTLTFRYNEDEGVVLVLA